MTRQNSLNRREFLCTALGVAASFSILPPGHRLVRDFLEPQRRYAPFQFPEEFIWGAATAAYQVEGAWNGMARANPFGTASRTPLAG